MTLTEQIYAQAMVLVQDSCDEKLQLLEILCRSAESSLRQNLRDGLTPEDCKADFVAAASLYALAALSEADEMKNLEQMQIGDVTVKRGSGSAAARCLRKQAQIIMFPFVEGNAPLRRV